MLCEVHAGMPELALLETAGGNNILNSSTQSQVLTKDTNDIDCVD